MAQNISPQNIFSIEIETSKEYIPYVESLVERYQLKKISKIVEGGSTRQESVKLGLLATNYDDNDKILIHDGDRPLVSHAIINQCISYLDECDALCPYLETEDRIDKLSNSGRTKLVRGKEVDIQTPQAFRYGLIKSKHIELHDKTFSDDIGLVEDCTKVKYFVGENTNFKVTEDKDLEYLQKLLQ